ncbi:hypothetical protein ACSBR2_010341 [Camellia fascicularis]
MRILSCMWLTGRRRIGRKKLNKDGREGEMAMIGGGGRLGKRSRSSFSDPQMVEEKPPCLLAYGIDGPVLYNINIVDEKSYKKSKFCQRCCIDVLGKDKDGKPELNERSSGGLRDLTPLKSKSSWVPCGSIVVALGSVVYVLGGLIKSPDKKFEAIYSRECFYFDTNRPKGGWIRGPHMLNGRHRGKAVAVEGKIYVFGGIDLDYAPEPWAEVLDPIKKKWEPLQRPPKPLGACTVLKAVAYYGNPWEEKKKIIFGSSLNYVYHLNSNTWEELPIALLPRCRNNLAGVGNLLYWTHMGMLRVFNMKSGRYYCGLIKGDFIGKYQNWSDPEPTLLHLGGKKFCLLTLDFIGGDRSRIRCFKLQVSKLIRGLNKDNGTLEASIVCRAAYIVDQPLSSWHGLVLYR